MTKRDRFVDDGPPVKILTPPKAKPAPKKSSKVTRIRNEDGDVRIILRHGDHDQSSHGDRGGGGDTSAGDFDRSVAGARTVTRIVNEDGDVRIVLRYSDDQERDENGRFGSGGGGGGSSSGGSGGVRGSLASAGTTAEVSAAAAAEAKAITGRDIEFDMTGQDPQIAREHSEGVLQGLERFPDAPLDGVRTADLSGTGYAEASAHVIMDEPGGSVIEFNSSVVGDSDQYRADTADGTRVTDTPTGLAVHEFGHVVATPEHETAATVLAGQSWQGQSDADRAPSPSAHIKAEVSQYAASDRHELVAEAFADVMVNGDSASQLSRDIFNLIEASPATA